MLVKWSLTVYLEPCPARRFFADEVVAASEALAADPAFLFVSAWRERSGSVAPGALASRHSAREGGSVDLDRADAVLVSSRLLWGPGAHFIASV